MKDIIISTGPLVGLGDHLLWSTLPRRFKALGHNVLLDSDCYARNQETLDIIWKGALAAGDIDAMTDRKPNAGYALHGEFYELLQFFPEGANLEVMERVHGLPPPYSIAPRIYYEPKPYRQNLSQACLLDFTALSSAISDEGWRQFLLQVWARKWMAHDLVVVQHKDSIGGRRQLQLETRPSTIVCESIYQFCDMIASSPAIFCSEAGSQALAAAIRGEHSKREVDAHPYIYSLMTVPTRNSRAFCYEGVDYHSSLYDPGLEPALKKGMDYLNPVEVHSARYAQMCKLDGMMRMEEWKATSGSGV